MEKSYCPVCRRYVENGRFCGSCGYTLSDSDETRMLFDEVDTPTVLLNSTITLSGDMSSPYVQNPYTYKKAGIPPSQYPVQQNTPSQHMNNISVSTPLTEQPAPTAPKNALQKNRRQHITTYIGVILLGVFVLGSFVIALIDSSHYIIEKYGSSVSVSVFWFCLLFVLSLGLCAAALIRNRLISVSAVSMVGVLMLLCIILSFAVTAGRTGKSHYDASTRLSRFLVYKCYGMAMLKMSVFWVSSLVLIIIGRFVKADVSHFKEG